MTAGTWDESHQHNFQALFCLRPEADVTLSSDMSQAAAAYMNAIRPQVTRPHPDVQAQIQPRTLNTSTGDSVSQETTQPEPMAARPQCHTIRITAEVPKSGTTLERLDLPVREEFYDSVGRALPALASSEALVLDMHAAAETLLLDCSLPTQLVPSLAEVLMLSKALTTALAVACQQLGCMHFGYTLQLNNHTALVKNLHTAETRLCPVENGCVPSIARVTLATQGLREPSNLEIIVTGCSSSSCSFVAKLPGQLKAVRLEILQQDLQLGQYLVECPNIVRKYQSTFHIEVQQGSLRGDFYTIESFQSLAAVHNRRASGHAGSEAPPCGPHTQTCMAPRVCQAEQATTRRVLRPRAPAKPLLPVTEKSKPAPQPVREAPRRQGVFDPDLSCRQETHPVAAVNLVDGCIVGFSEPSNIVLTDTIDERCRAAHRQTLKYITESVRAPGVPKPPPAVLPAQYRRPHDYVSYLNGNQLPYKRYGSEGRYRAFMQPVVYECGPHFGCPEGINCPQAATQRGCPFHLELRQTQNKGWALHTLDAIPAGTFVIDYTGLIRHQTLLDDSSTQSSWRDGDTVEADHGEDTAANHDEYAFDMEAPRPGCEDMDLPLLPVLGQAPLFVLDAQDMGNVARFANHSCNPNTYVQPVLTWHHDHAQPRICLFAEHDISPGTELTFDYGNGYVKNAQWRCCCGAKDCVAYTREATPAESSQPLDDALHEDRLSPAVPSQPVPVVSGARASSTGSHNTERSTGIYRHNRAEPPLKRRKTSAQAEWVYDLKEFPELRKAAQGLWPSRTTDQATGTNTALISQPSHTVQPDRVEQQHAFEPFQEVLDDPGFAADQGPSDLAAQLSHISIQGVTSGQEASTEEASHKHNDIKRLLARSPRTRRLKSSYVAWMRRDSCCRKQQSKVVQLHTTLKQLEANSRTEAEVVDCWVRHIMALF